MTIEVPLYTLAMADAGAPFTLSGSEGLGNSDELEVILPELLAGRSVREEYSLADLKSLIAETGVILNDALGLILQSEGETILVTVSVGSGNERFLLKPEDLAAGLAKFE